MGIAACCARAASGHAAEQRDELASLHRRHQLDLLFGEWAHLRTP